MKLTDFALENRTTVYVLMAAIFVAGAFCYAVLPREAAPDIQIPYIGVTTFYEGVDPSDIETLITMKIEKELKGLKNVKEIRSSSIEGLSSIMVEFEPNVNIEDALQRVRDKVDMAKRDLPQDLESDPTITEFNIADWPILLVNITGVEVVRLKEIADRMEETIEAIAGVLNVDVVGAVEREIRLEFDPDRLSAYNINPYEAIEAIRQNNLNVPSGALELGPSNFMVKVPGEFRDPSEIDNIVISTRNGKPIYLLDVARVVDGYKERTTYSRLNGEPTVTLAIQKRSGENIIRITDEVKALLKKAETMVPAGVRFSWTADQSKSVRMMVADLENHLLSGLVLVVGIIMVTIGFRNSIVVSLAIPYSMLIAFCILYGSGITLNMIVLFSLTLSAGRLVDDAIVVCENIHRHHQMGMPPAVAAHLGTAEVAWPVTASTVATVAAFVPLLFWPGIMGDFMGYLPRTVIITLSASLFVALVITPCISTLAMKKAPKAGSYRPGGSKIGGYYVGFLNALLRHRWSTLVLISGLLVVMIRWFAATGLGTQFFPESEPGAANISVTLPEGSSLDASDAVVRRIEALAREFPECKQVVANVGGGAGGDGLFGAGGGAATNKSNISIEFVDREFRQTPTSRIIDILRERVAEIPGAEIVVDKERHGPPTGKPISLEISGDDFDTIGRLAAEASLRIRAIEGITDLKDNYVVGKPEVQVRIDKEKAALMGLSTNIVGQMMRTAILGTKAGVYRVANDEYDVVVRLPKAQRSEADTLARLNIPNAQGAQIPLSSVAVFKWTSGLGSIERVDEKRTVTITADMVEGYNQNALLAQARKLMEKTPFPPAYTFRFTGQDKEQRDATAFLSKAFVAAIILISMVLVMEFDSLLLPFIILTSVILSWIGVFLGLILTRTPFGIIMTGLGVISLAGVVVSNAIVLIAYTEQLRQRGLSVRDAVTQASLIRFRPVVLTAITTILGLLPMATGISFDFRKMAWDIGSESSQMWGPLAVAVIFGLGVATLLTLGVVPSLYVILDPLRGSRRHREEVAAEGPARAPSTALTREA